MCHAPSRVSNRKEQDHPGRGLPTLPGALRDYRLIYYSVCSITNIGAQKDTEAVLHVRLDTKCGERSGAAFHCGDASSAWRKRTPAPSPSYQRHARAGGSTALRPAVSDGRGGTSSSPVAPRLVAVKSALHKLLYNARRPNSCNERANASGHRGAQ